MSQQLLTEQTAQALLDAINALVDLLTPKLVLDQFNQKVTGGNSFGDIQPSRPVSAFRVTITADTTGVFSYIKSKQNAPGTTVTKQLNGGTALTANADYTFDVLVVDGEQISFQFGVNATLLDFKVYEILAETV